MEEISIGAKIQIVFILVVGLIWFMTNTLPHAEALSILEIENISQVELTGYDLFACSGDDWSATGFTGIKNGKKVRGTICSGVFKSKTIRWK